LVLEEIEGGGWGREGVMGNEVGKARGETARECGAFLLSVLI
jgi:hypothetical protein